MPLKFIIQNNIMKAVDGILTSYNFKSEQDRSIAGVLSLAANIESYAEGILQPYNITLRQYRIMRQLRILYPDMIAVSDLREYVIHKKADVSRMAERLVRTGWLEKITCEKDKRVTYVKITQQGIGLMNMIEPLEKNFSKPINILTDANLGQFNEYIELMLGSFSN